MKKTSLRNLVFSLVAMGLATTAIATGVETLLTRNPLQHSDSVHKSRHEIFNAFVAPTIGGVIAQGEVRGPFGGSDVVLNLPDSDKYDGNIEVTVGGLSGQLEIRYDELVRAALFADGGRTALYTLWNQDELPIGFAQDAGFLAAVPRGMVAIEFRTTAYGRQLHLLDYLLTSCLVRVPPNSVLSNLNEALASETENPSFVFDTPPVFDVPPFSSYIVSDLARPFRLTVRDGRVSLKGALHRYHWNAARGGVASVTRMTLLDPSACDENDLAVLNRMTSLFGTIALMRTARAHDEAAFVEFLNALSAEELIKENSQPWEDYTTAAIELYPHLKR